jgi:hypothetical protein
MYYITYYIIVCEYFSGNASFLGEDEKKGHHYFTNNSLNAGVLRNNKIKKCYKNTHITASHSSVLYNRDKREK